MILSNHLLSRDQPACVFRWSMQIWAVLSDMINQISIPLLINRFVLKLVFCLEILIQCNVTSIFIRIILSNLFVVKVMNIFQGFFVFSVSFHYAKYHTEGKYPYALTTTSSLFAFCCLEKNMIYVLYFLPKYSCFPQVRNLHIG